MESDWRVPMLDLSRERGALQAPLAEAFARVVNSGRYILGPEVATFERDACNYLHVEHCVGMSSGTDALLATLLALGVGPGDEVITSPLTFVATGEAILRLGAVPVFADICARCYCLDPGMVKRAISHRTKAILTVELFGQLGHVEQLAQIAHDADLSLVEDACQSFGARLNGRAAGTFGRAGCFSFFPSKTLGGFGDAGLVATNDPELAAQLRALRTHGSTEKNRYSTLGGNFRLDALHGALLCVLLPHLDQWLNARRLLAKFYSESLANNPQLNTPKVCDNADSAWSVYTVRVPRHRDALRAHLANCGIETAVYYPATLVQQPLFAGTARSIDSLPVATATCREVLSLPIFPALEKGAQLQVIASIQQYFEAEDADDSGLASNSSATITRRTRERDVIVGP